jgi:hypothetical protein
MSRETRVPCANVVDEQLDQSPCQRAVAAIVL